jgi:DNA-binding winged helix-turn-helix (wHTH) protein
MGEGPNDVLRFGVFEADARSGELRRKGLRVRLQEQPFQVLLMLAQRPNEVVSREELRQALWPSDTFVDFDHGLNTAINKLRDALGDSAASPRFIETLPRRGYRFVAPVERVNGTASATETGVVVPPESPPGQIAGAPGSESVSVKEDAVETDIDEIPSASRRVTRTLFGLAQIMYLIFYFVALFRLDHLHEVLPDAWIVPAMVAIVVSAPVGIALRLYFLTAVAFDYAKLGANFLKLFWLVFVLDVIWALAPFLLTIYIGVGGAIASCAALVYLPFSQRTLVRMGYGRR